MSGVIAEALTQEEVAEIERELGYATSTTNLPNIIGGTRAAGNKLVISYAELLELRELEIPLDGFWVWANNEENRGLVPATKVNKWIGLGYKPE